MVENKFEIEQSTQIHLPSEIHDLLISYLISPPISYLLRNQRVIIKQILQNAAPGVFTQSPGLPNPTTLPLDSRSLLIFTQEVTMLLGTVQEVKPQSHQEWKEVCMRMHALGSRRLSCDYKNKFQRQMAKQQRNSIAQYNQINKNILFLFQEGHSPNAIAEILQVITSSNVKILLSRLLTQLAKNMSKVIGKNNVHHLKTKDHQLFSFLKQENKNFIKAHNINNLCQFWQWTLKEKGHLELQTPGRYQQFKLQLKTILHEYNSTLRACSQQLAHLKSLKSRTQSQQLQPKLNKTPTVAFLHLRNVTESPTQFMEQLNLLQDLSDNKDRDLQKPMWPCLKTMQSIGQDENEQQHQRYRSHNSQDSNPQFDLPFQQQMLIDIDLPLWPQLAPSSSVERCYSIQKYLDSDQFLQ